MCAFDSFLFSYSLLISSIFHFGVWVSVVCLSRARLTPNEFAIVLQELTGRLEVSAALIAAQRGFVKCSRSAYVADWYVSIMSQDLTTNWHHGRGGIKKRSCDNLRRQLDRFAGGIFSSVHICMHLQCLCVHSRASGSLICIIMRYINKKLNIFISSRNSWNVHIRSQASPNQLECAFHWLRRTNEKWVTLEIYLSSFTFIKLISILINFCELFKSCRAESHWDLLMRLWLVNSPAPPQFKFTALTCDRRRSTSIEMCTKRESKRIKKVFLCFRRRTMMFYWVNFNF